MAENKWQELFVGRTIPASSFAVFGVNLTTGIEVGHNSNRLIEAASTIKVLVLAYLLSQVQARQCSLSNIEFINELDRTDAGSGVLQWGTQKSPLELGLLAQLMMLSSDNIATNCLVRVFGVGAINDFAQKLSLEHTRLVGPRLDFSTKTPEGIEVGVSTPVEMVRLVRKLVTGELLRPDLTSFALGLLQGVTGSHFFRGIDIDQFKQSGSKTGWTYPDGDTCLGECGFMVNAEDHTAVFAVYSRLPSDPQLPYSIDALPRKMFGHVSRFVYDQLFL